MSTRTIGGSAVSQRPPQRRHNRRLTAHPPTGRSTAHGSVISVVRLKQAAVQLTQRSSDAGAWAAAEGVLTGVDRWVWAAAGSQLGRIGGAHRRLDPVVSESSLLDAPPAAPRDEEEYGLTADGTVVAQRTWIGGSGPLLHAYLREGGDLLIHRWDEAGERAGIELVRQDDQGRLLYTVDVNAAGECFGERYAWDGDVLQAVELVTVSSSSRPQARRVRVTDRFIYNGR